MAPSAVENPFAVLDFAHWNHPWNNFHYKDRKELEKTADLLARSGCGMVRMDFLWGDIEPRQGEFDFGKYDMIVDVLSSRGIGILGILDYTADWASPACAWNVPPEDNSFFIAFARTVVGRYKDRIRHWELWNEPDSQVYWKDQDGMKRYCRMLGEVYQALKREDPSCLVLNGGLANGLSSVNRLYDNGAGPYFDILNIHVFESPVYPGSIHKVLSYVKLARKVMARNGDDGKKLWITEIGCPGIRPGKRIENWWMGKNPRERLQAEWVSEVYDALVKEPGVEKIFWAFFRDTDGHFKDGVDYFGLVRHDFSPKPAFKAYKKAYERWLQSTTVNRGKE